MRLIDADAAIDAVAKWMFEVFGIKESYGAATVFERLRELPSAQSEIIRCRDCKHRDEYGCCEHWKGLLMSAIPIATDDDDFCSKAERRTDD